MPNIYNSSLPLGCVFSQKSDITPIEIINLRESVGWYGDTSDRWSVVIGQSLEIISVRNSANVLVGMACLAGNLRHAVMCDLAVHPEYQKQGIGEAIMSKLEESVSELSVKYVYAELAKTNPFREKMIESGFKVSGNGLFREP